LTAGFFFGVLNLILLIGFRHNLPLLFTDDEDVKTIVSASLPVLAMMQVFDSMAVASHGVLRGIGRQYVGAYTNLFAFYIFALPVSFSTSFKLGWGIAGLWAGVTVGLIV
jgi:multidrug resistance protein, MATE family